MSCKKYDNGETRVQIRRDKEYIWNQRDPILLEGEIGYNITNKKIKIGNGLNSWSNLPYLNENDTDHILFNTLPELP